MDPTQPAPYPTYTADGNASNSAAEDSTKPAAYPSYQEGDNVPASSSTSASATSSAPAPAPPAAAAQPPPHPESSIPEYQSVGSGFTNPFSTSSSGSSSNNSFPPRAPSASFVAAQTTTPTPAPGPTSAPPPSAATAAAAASINPNATPSNYSSSTTSSSHQKTPSSSSTSSTGKKPIPASVVRPGPSPAGPPGWEEARLAKEQAIRDEEEAKKHRRRRSSIKDLFRGAAEKVSLVSAKEPQSEEKKEAAVQVSQIGNETRFSVRPETLTNALSDLCPVECLYRARVGFEYHPPSHRLPLEDRKTSMRLSTYVHTSPSGAAPYYQLII
ncbi:hypothetical protein BDZ90DRAFT_169237 [Jaminaea rosea]|uniref:Uncharacterized protein n=1 Tax=Jaminaea rosea TaxID=1569628 RepID=A0A316USC3_9BASI|nr:hypothetical protein BDZ90DRAFT_169237 [Jaminaea rosea]PWN27678.1 hypothetical protein BDZ90DRAFT_169237 [Jaminaea rosea]